MTCWRQGAGTDILWGLLPTLKSMILWFLKTPIRLTSPALLLFEFSFIKMPKMTWGRERNIASRSHYSVDD